MAEAGVIAAEAVVIVAEVAVIAAEAVVAGVVGEEAFRWGPPRYSGESVSFPCHLLLYIIRLTLPAMENSRLQTKMSRRPRTVTWPRSQRSSVAWPACL